MKKYRYITDISARIEGILKPLIQSDYVFLEIPFYVNPGDILIWKGTQDFLNGLPYKCLYTASALTFEHERVPEGATIILQGGGNFGDLYRLIQDFRNRIIELFPNNRIIILPQTVYYQSYKYTVKDKAISCRHKDLHICARDSYSYRFLKWQGFSKHIYLVPDMAFCIDTSYFDQFKLQDTGKELLFKRTDKEFKTNSVTGDWTGKDVSDWTLYTNPDGVVKKLNAMLSSMTTDNKDEINKYLTNVFFPHQIKSAVELISQYKKTYCTRLHAAILSILLDKDVVILDNSYGKNRHFYKTWLSGFSNVSIKRSPLCLDYKHAARMAAAFLKNRLFNA